MSLSMLVGGGAECGPSNPLQSLAKRFDQDRGLQQDIAGPSRSKGDEAHFRTQHAPVPALQQEAARFFGAGAGPAALASQTQTHAPLSMMSMPVRSFDVAGLRDALPSAQASAAWAADFLAHPHRPAAIQSQARAHEGQAQVVPASRVGAVSPVGTGGFQSGALPWSSVYTRYGMNPMIGLTSSMAVQAQRHVVQGDRVFSDAHMGTDGPDAPIEISWDKEFQSQESLLNPSIPASEAQQERQQDGKGVVPADEMAQLAAQVIDSVKHEQNPKFQKSEFMNLMRQLRDGEVIVEQDNIIPKEGTTSAGVDVKGKGRAVATNDDVAVQSPPSQAQVHPLYQGSEGSNAAYVQQANDDPHEAYFRQENADFTEYWNAHHAAPSTRVQEQQNPWHEKLQRDWEAFEAATAAIEPVANYQFQTNNPYLLGDSSSKTRNHSLHMSHSERVYESVLELEAAVQRDPTNAAAWFELGVKQQENEREAKAVQALQRATDLDLAHLPAWLALSVSYTNDNNRLGTFDAIRQWVMQHPKYGLVASGSDLSTAARGDMAPLINVLIRMARHADQKGRGVDADVQVALAVLLNTTEEYTKAVDCFLAALAVRPGDWLLYNRVGATMANNGQAEHALQYYYRALELNPAYIRARFNLGISCINLRRYEEAASHILDALVLQDSDRVEDGTGMNDLRGLTTSTLWESLKTTCWHLQRSDLAAMCDRGDLEGLKREFQEA